MFEKKIYIYFSRMYFETAYSRRLDSGGGAKRSEQEKQLGSGLGVRAPFPLSLSPPPYFIFSSFPTSRRTPLSELLEQVNFETKTYYSTVVCKACQAHVASTFSLLMLPYIPVDLK